VNSTHQFGFALAEFAKNTAIFGQKFSAKSNIPDSKKSTHITYKGTKIEPLSDDNIYSWINDTINLFIVKDLWQFINPNQAPAIISSQKDNKTITRQLAIARAVLSLLITHDTWQ
jgi:hypothetical protein